MDDALIGKIKSLGHTRVNIRPVAAPEEQLSPLKCHEVVERAAVSLRGWDFPHIHKRAVADEHGARENVGTYAQHWCDWDYHVEFWRMYRSTQFLFYKVLREDLHENLKEKPNTPFVEVGWSIYFLTEALEFLARLFREGIYKNGCSISISFHLLGPRQLWIGDPRRMGFSYPRETHAGSIELFRQLSPQQIENDSKETSLEMALEFFAHFGWEPSPDQIRTDQDRLLSRRL